MGKHRIEGSPPENWEQKCIILPGETPWWMIEDLWEQGRVRCKQNFRMWYKEHPELHYGLDSDRPNPGHCELCPSTTKRLNHHHWDDDNPRKGIWVCSRCHFIVGYFDKIVDGKYDSEIRLYTMLRKKLDALEPAGSMVQPPRVYAGAG